MKIENEKEFREFLAEQIGVEPFFSWRPDEEISQAMELVKALQLKRFQFQFGWDPKGKHWVARFRDKEGVEFVGASNNTDFGDSIAVSLAAHQAFKKIEEK